MQGAGDPDLDFCPLYIIWKYVIWIERSGCYTMVWIIMQSMQAGGCLHGQ